MSGSDPGIEWLCEVCKEEAIDSLKLEYQHLPGKIFFRRYER